MHIIYMTRATIKLPAIMHTHTHVIIKFATVDLSLVTSNYLLQTVIFNTDHANCIFNFRSVKLFMH